MFCAHMHDWPDVFREKIKINLDDPKQSYLNTLCIVTTTNVIHDKSFNLQIT
jgi:hypothetical protein